MKVKELIEHLKTVNGEMEVMKNHSDGTAIKFDSLDFRFFTVCEMDGIVQWVSKPDHLFCDESKIKKIFTL